MKSARAVMREAIVAIIVSFICVAAHAREICTEQDGGRSCKVERPEQPEPPQETVPLDAPSRPNVTVRAAAPLPPEYRACITAAANKLPRVATHGIKGSRALPQQSAGLRPGVHRVTVEIDVSVAGQDSTYIFNCVRDGRLTVIQPLGMR
jgi:hypothetical protein